MKRQLSFGFILLALASLACQVTLTPRPTPLPPPSATATITLTPLPTETETPTVTPTPPLTASSGPALLELHMFSPMRGWGLTEDQILITGNGGLSWAQVPLPGVTVDSSVSAHFFNADIAYFFAPTPGTRVGQLFITQDGGATWKTFLSPFNSAKIYFADQRVGFAFQTLSVVDNLMTIAIYVTIDFGENWSQAFIHTAKQGNTNLPIEGIKTGMSFGNLEKGSIGLQAQDNTVGLYHTKDSGQNWEKQTLTLPDGLGDYQSTVWPPYFLPGNENHDTGFLPVDFIAASGASIRVFYLTHDAGATWEKGGEIPDGAAYFFLDKQTGWAWGGHDIYATSDGAKTWNQTPASFGPKERASIISFADSQNGWLVTVDTKNILRMYHTVDGGATWTAIIF